jgi:hypothetical protein
MSEVQIPPAAPQKKSPVGLIVLISVLVVAVLAVGGWFTGCYIATKEAKSRLDKALADVQSATGQTLSYDSISATPLKSMTVTGLRVFNPEVGIESTFERMEVSANEGSDGLSGDVTVGLYGMVVPWDKAAQKDPSMARDLQPLMELGYNQLKGDVTYFFSYDHDKGLGETSFSIQLDDMITISASMVMADVDLSAAQGLENMQDLPQQQQEQMLQAAMMQVILGNQTAKLSDLELMVDTRGLFDRMKTHNKGQGEIAEAAANASESVDPSVFILFGQTPEQARASHDAIVKWIAEGGKLHFKTDIKKPLEVSLLTNQQTMMQFAQGLNFTLTH